MLSLLMFIFLSVSRERRNTQPKGNIFYSTRKFLVVFFNNSCSYGTDIYFPAPKRKISIKDRHNTLSFSKLFLTTSTSFEHELP